MRLADDGISATLPMPPTPFSRVQYRGVALFSNTSVRPPTLTSNQ
jgi:hypothetical protein